MKKAWPTIAILLLVFAGILIWQFAIPPFNALFLALTRLRDQAGWAGGLLYVLTVAVAEVLLLPGFFLTVGAGYLFGAVKGTLLFVMSETLGACLAFGIARHFFGARMRDYFRKHPKFARVNRALALEGWKFIALTRMTPLFPFKLSNYFFGAADFGFHDFFWGTLLGIMPFSVTLVYLGSLATNWGSLASGPPHSAAWKIAAVSLGVIAVAGLAFIGRHAARRLQGKLPPEDEPSVDS